MDTQRNSCQLNQSNGEHFATGMDVVFRVLSWVFGVLLLLTGLMVDTTLGGLALILISLLLLPPVRNFAFRKTNRSISARARGIAIFVLFIAFFVFDNQTMKSKAQEVATKEAQAQAEKTAAFRQGQIDYFNQHSSQILNEAKAAFASGNFKEVLSLSSKHNLAQNQELIELSDKARIELAATKKREKEAKENLKTQEILAQLKTIPADQHQQKIALYQQLVAHNPTVEEYKEKLHYHSGMVKKLEEIKRIESEKYQENFKKEYESALVRFGPPPTKNKLDDSYFPVKTYLKNIANDPGSIEIVECTEVLHSKNGWVVGCKYRGRNAFGAKVLQSSMFTIDHGKVIGVLSE